MYLLFCIVERLVYIGTNVHLIQKFINFLWACFSKMLKIVEVDDVIPQASTTQTLKILLLFSAIFENIFFLALNQIDMGYHLISSADAYV